MSEQRTTGVRKPYKISKPREKWTEKEHERFVTAINRFGRDWKRIVAEVGTRTVAQVRSHAQKYFLKLEKNGNVDEVPPARAKRPSTKPYPVKGSGEDGSSASGQSTGLLDPKRPRRTERVITKPNRHGFTAYNEDDQGVSPGPGSSTEEVVLLQANEGKSSNNNDLSGSAESFNDPHGSVLSSQYRRLASIQSVPQMQPVYSEPIYSSDQRAPDITTPTDESSGGVITGHNILDNPDYGDLYDVVGRLYQSQSCAPMLQQLGSSQRQELVARMDHISDGLRNGLDHMPSTDSPPMDVNSHLDGAFTPPSYPTEVTGYPADVSTIPTVFHSPSPPPVEMGTLPDIPQTPANTQGTGLLPSCTQPSELDQSGWKLLGMSGDLNSILPGSTDLTYNHQPARFDAHIFDY